MANQAYMSNPQTA